MTSIWYPTPRKNHQCNHLGVTLLLRYSLSLICTFKLLNYKISYFKLFNYKIIAFWWNRDAKFCQWICVRYLLGLRFNTHLCPFHTLNALISSIFLSFLMQKILHSGISFACEGTKTVKLTPIAWVLVHMMKHQNILLILLCLKIHRKEKSLNLLPITNLFFLASTKLCLSKIFFMIL